MRYIISIFAFLILSATIAFSTGTSSRTGTSIGNLGAPGTTPIKDTVIYISSSAAAGGDGSISTPYDAFSDINWTTIANLIAAGTKVYINLQGIFDETTGLDFGASGSSSALLVVQSYGDGAKIEVATGTNYPSLRIANHDYITVRNITIDGSTTGSGSIYLTGSLTQIVLDNLTVNNSLNDKYGIYCASVTGSGVTIKNCTIDNDGTGGRGIYLFNSTGIEIDNNDIGSSGHTWNSGIRLYSGTDNNIISNNTVIGGDSDAYGLRLAGNSNIINNNTVSGITSSSGIGIQLTGDAGSSIYSNTVSNCKLYGIYLNNTDTNLVYGNNVSDIWNDLDYGSGGVGQGILVEGSSEGNKIYNNTLSLNYIGITDNHSSGAGLNLIYGNLVKECLVNGIVSSNGTSTATIPTFAGNTIIHKPMQDVGHAIVCQGATKGMKVYNNIIVGEDITASTNVEFIQIQADAGDGTYDVEIDYNLYYNNGLSIYGWKYPNGTGVTRTETFSTWITNINRAEIAERDANTINDSDPDLTTVGKLETDSPALETGVAISGINDVGTLDLWGNAAGTLKNIGAYSGQGE